MNTVKEAWCLIPARSGSTGVPDKNFRSFAGSSLLERTIKDALRVFAPLQIVVSSDDRRAEDLTNRYGTLFHRRPGNLATSEAKVSEVLSNVLEEYQWADDDVLSLLEPTCPLRDPGEVKEALDAIISGTLAGSRAIVSVSSAPAPAQKLMVLTKSGELRPAVGDGYQVGNRQDLPTNYFADGAFYIFRISEFRRLGHVPIVSARAYFSKSRVVDINDEKDFDLAERLLVSSVDKPGAVHLPSDQ